MTTSDSDTKSSMGHTYTTTIPAPVTARIVLTSFKVEQIHTFFRTCVGVIIQPFTLQTINYFYRVWYGNKLTNISYVIVVF